MAKVNWGELVRSGEIKTFSELLNCVKVEILNIYHLRFWWPAYTPSPDDVYLIRFFMTMELEEEMDFSTFCLIWKANPWEKDIELANLN